MKTKFTALLLCTCLTLTGCASILERTYVDVTPHTSTKTDAGAPSVLRVENYQELVNSMISFISTGSEDGVIRLYMDADQVDENLRAARQEVMLEYPLGAYAVESISFQVEPLVAFSEAEVTFTYRRTRQQVSSIVNATGISAVRSELSAALSSFAPECVLRISYFDRDAEYVRSLIRQAWYASPASAVEFPSTEVTIYPDTGSQRIAEILFTYDAEPSVLSQRVVLLEQACRRLANGLPRDEGDLLTHAARAILEAGGYDPERGSTPYHALLEGGADDEGLALAMAAVCQDQLDVSCKVAGGIRDGEVRFWNVVSTADGWRHVDLSRWEESQPFSTDEAWAAEGYLWDPAALPACS